MSTPIKIVLAGDYGTENLGDQGMLAVLRERLIERFDPQITVLSRKPSEGYERLYRVRTIEDFHPKDGTRSSQFRGFRHDERRDHLVHIADAVRDADLLVLGGGRMFFDYRSSFLRGNLAACVQLSSLAHFLDTPVMLFAMSVASEASEIARDHIRYVAEGADIVTVRELPSRDNLVELGVARDRVHVLPDPTLGLPRIDPDVSYGLRPGAEWMEDADRMLRGLELPDDRRLVGVNVKSFAWRDGAAGQTEMEGQLAALLDDVVRDLECSLLFIPQDTSAADDADDRAMARSVLARMEARDACRALEKELTIWQALALYQRVDGLVSMRRHGLTFALTQRTPVVSISVDENADYLMTSLGIAENTIGLVPARRARSLEVVRRVIGGADAGHENLAAHVEECAARTRAYVDLLAERVGGSAG